MSFDQDGFDRSVRWTRICFWITVALFSGQIIFGIFRIGYLETELEECHEDVSKSLEMMMAWEKFETRPEEKL